MPAPDLISRAARFFVLAEQASRLWEEEDKRFWDMSASPVAEPAYHLPAVAAAVRAAHLNNSWPNEIWKFIHHPLPAVLSSEAVLWHNHLVAAWELHRASGQTCLNNIALRELVRLDGCGMPDGQERPSRLPEWLAEARKIASGRGDEPVTRAGQGRPGGRPYRELETLAALAAWRPAPRVHTPPETLRKWTAFWMERCRSTDPVERGIAAIALLNLPEVERRPASISRVPTAQLLRQLTTAIQVAAEGTEPECLSLLNWQPVKATNRSGVEVRKVSRTWLEVTRHEAWRHRYAAWRQLFRWDRAGRLDICGTDLLSELAKAVPTEEDGDVLWVLAQWTPGLKHLTSTGTSDRRSPLRQLESAWKQHRTSKEELGRASAWLAGIRLHQAGPVSEPQKNFLDAYLSQVADEQDRTVLFILAQWSPGTGVPGTWHQRWQESWQQRLMDKNERIRQIAAWALLHQSMEKEEGRSLRCAALELWRAGAKASSDVKDTLSAAFVRFQDVQARLAAREVVDFEGGPTPPAERCRPPLALPPGRITGSEWKMENEELKMESGKWRMKHQEVTPNPNRRRVPDSPSR